MRRSDINRLIREAEALMAEHRIALPPWATWSPDVWHARGTVAGYCRSHQMGWDVTDFGSGRFAERGLLLLCLRNGIQGRPDERPYAEKLLIVGPGQETPFHFHRVKMEDIIVRAGGTLIAEMQETDREGKPRAEAVTIECDGERRTVPPTEPVRLRPGESVTMHRGLAHRFYGDPGGGPVIVGEVSQVNDDFSDNYFLEPIGRFAAVEEDEPPQRLLWNELPLA
jgi:D-lyxose ketol-isomerase